MLVARCRTGHHHLANRSPEQAVVQSNVGVHANTSCLAEGVSRGVPRQTIAALLKRLPARLHKAKARCGFSAREKKAKKFAFG